VFRRASRQPGVARWKKFKVVEACTAQALRLLHFHEEEGSLPHLRAACRTPGVAQDLEYDKLWSLFELLLKLLLFSLRMQQV
jgi:hypothetical protein